MSYGLAAKSDLPTSWINSVFGDASIPCYKYAVWALSPECWKYSPEAWEQINSFSLPVTAADIKPPAAVPLAYTGKPTYAGETSAEVIGQYTAEQDAVIKRAAEENRQRILEHVQADPSYIPDPESGGIPWYWWLVGGLGVFGLIAVSGGGPRRYGR